MGVRDFVVHDFEVSEIDFDGDLSCLVPANFGLPLKRNDIHTVIVQWSNDATHCLLGRQRDTVREYQE